MTLPVAFARKRPLLVAGVLVAGALVNWGAIGTYVRCGATLPAVFYMAFVVGSRCEGRERAIGEGLVICSIFVQCESDPQLYPLSNAVLFIPISLAFLGAGYLLHRRNVTVEALRARTVELQQQRERNANLAVEADRARIAGDLDGYLHGQVSRHRRCRSCRAGNRSSHGPDQAADAFVAIQGTGRETLTHMRQVVGSLRDEAPTGPQPVLAQLDRLLGESDESTSVSRSRGDPRLLPPGLELSGYRIVEHLLSTLEKDPTTPAASRSCSARTRSSSRWWARACARASPGRRWPRQPSGPTSTAAPCARRLRDGLRETLVLIPLAAGAV